MDALVEYIGHFCKNNTIVSCCCDTLGLKESDQSTVMVGMNTRNQIFNSLYMKIKEVPVLDKERCGGCITVRFKS